MPRGRPKTRESTPQVERQREYARDYYRRKKANEPLKGRVAAISTAMSKEEQRARANAARRERHAEISIALARYKLERQCADCDRHFDKAYHLDFDHRPGVTKLFNLSKFGSRNTVAIWREVAKCDVVCALCHRTRTYDRAQADADYGRWQYLEGWGTPEDQLVLWAGGDEAG